MLHFWQLEDQRPVIFYKSEKQQIKAAERKGEGKGRRERDRGWEEEDFVIL